MVALRYNVLALLALPSRAGAAFSSAQGKAFTGVRFSIYPNVGKDDDPSLKEAVKTAVAGLGDLGDLGLEIRTDAVSSCLLGPEPALFEAVRSCFARACYTPTGQPRGASLQATFSAGCPGEDIDETPLPARTAENKDGMEFVEDAYRQPPRIAAQFAVYPLGSVSYMETIYKVIGNAKKEPCWKEGKTHFCSMLDGDGNQVFDSLRESFALAREDAGGHIVMTATLTANKSAWPEEDRSASTNA